MPLPLLAPALVAGGAALVGSAVDAFSGANANKKNREFAEQQYARQQADNERMWNMTNTYNSPQEQMKRLQEAGLNPNLIYGSGGQTGGTASPMTAPSASYTHKPSSFDVKGPAQAAFNTYFDTQIKTANVDNLTAQNDVIRQEALLKGAQTFGVELDNELKASALPDDLQWRQQRASELGNRAVIRANEAEIILKTKEFSIEKAMQQLSQMRLGVTLTGEQIAKIRNDQEAQQLDLELKRNGFNPNDPIYLRLLGRLAASLGINIK